MGRRIALHDEHMQGARLFVRGEECIWLQRSSEGPFDLSMNGPLKYRQHFAFPDECRLEQFVADTEERLIETGWSVQHFKPGEDRRSADRRISLEAQIDVSETVQ